MWFKKKKDEVIEASVSCSHKWMDFPAYIDYKWDYKKDSEGHNFFVKIIEPYVCIHCKERMDKTLTHLAGYNSSPEKQVKEIMNEYKQYPFISPRAVVEDMVLDFQNVDTDYIAWYNYIHGKGPKPQIELQI